MGCAASSDQPSYSQRTGQGYPVQQTKPVGTVQPNAQALAYQEQQLAQQRQQQLQQQQYQQQLQQQSQQQSVQQQQIQAPPQPQKDQSSPYRPIQAVRPVVEFRFSAVADLRRPSNVAQVEITKEILQRYVELEKKTHELEDQNIVKSLKMKTEQLNEIKLNVEMYEKQYAQCVEQTKKEKDDVDKMQEPSVKDFFNDQAAFDTQLSKEQEEYLEALNKQEVTEKALDGAKKQHEKVAAEVAGLKVEAEELYAIYKEQDELLAKLFGGKYGSDLEYKLETELDMLLDRKQRIGVAKYKWQNGRVLLNHACNQLAFASKRWQDLPKVQANNTQMKYQVATETRNNLIAASQNITSAQQYLNTIQFPYCKPEEIATLDKAAQNIYTDMQTPERQAHALQCYSTTHRRSAALIQWFDYVISSTIVKDMHSATVDVNKKEKQLRDERLRLIKAKVSEHLDEDVDALFQSNEEYEDPVEAADREVAMMFEADDVSDSGDLPGGDPAMPEGLEAPGAGMKAPTPMPLDQLAPAPGTTDLFGNIDELKKQHEQEIEEFNRAQEMNKVRMDQGLQEKLMARRSRRARQTAQPPAV
ncbi:putative mediator of RNA polymerase II transcription subunit 26 isoform X3 [Lineus longissimus]|uniref:putative mediator of RNA polymerase II transcription subunit 26 isoform X3 n=1 Tax=Lineus longissimus TaxID=88925 RepID=UPI002B4DC262